MRDDGSRQRVRRGRLSYPAKTKTSGYYPLFLSLFLSGWVWGPYLFRRYCYRITRRYAIDPPPIRILC